MTMYCWSLSGRDISIVSASPLLSLSAVKDTVNPWSSSLHPQNRREETILARLRIGHTNFTHSYLMSTPHNPIPLCATCNAIMSVGHFLTECREYARQRFLFLRGKTLQEILSENAKFSSFNLFKFLRSSNLLDKI